MEDKTFVREIELESINKTLKIQQKVVGDVGCVVWDAAIVLSKYLETKSHKLNLKGKRIIELGAGVGCVGLTASCFGADVIMTDLPEIIPLLESNITVNKSTWENSGGTAVAKPLKWSSDFKNEEMFQADLLLMADCVYYPESKDDLLSTMTTLCNEHTELIICQEERETDRQKSIWRSFLKSFDEVFDYYRVPEEEQHPHFHSSDICLIRARKRTTLGT